MQAWCLAPAERHHLDRNGCSEEDGFGDDDDDDDAAAAAADGDDAAAAAADGDDDDDENDNHRTIPRYETLRSRSSRYCRYRCSLIWNHIIQTGDKIQCKYCKTSWLRYNL